MPKEIHYYDTTNAIRNYDKDRIDNPYHSFNVTIPLKFPLINLKSISLKNVELPVKLPPIRQSNSTLNFKIKFSYSTFTNISITISLSSLFYSIATLIQEINTKITAVTTSYSGLSIVFSAFAGNAESIGSICKITHNCSALEIEDTPLTNYILGYTTIFTAGALAGVFNAESPINLNAIDTCVYIKLTNLPVMNNNSPNGYTFKIPLNNVINGTVYFSDASEHQTIYFNNTNFVLNKLDVVVVDRLGFNLSGFNHWTFSLIIDYAEINNNTPQFLNINN